MTDGAADVVALTRALIAAPSPNPPGDERAAVAVIADRLAGVPDVQTVILGPRSERPSLVASVGSGPDTLTLAAHLDTHPVAPDWTRDPFAGEIDGGRLYGLGATDNKGAAAAMTVAFCAAAQHGLPAGTQLVLVANADEEQGGEHGIGYVRDAAPVPLGAVVVAEPSGIFEPWERLWIAARGTSRFTLEARGDETHASLAGRPGADSAIEHLQEALATLERELASLLTADRELGERGRLTVVELAGGIGYGVVPGYARASVELRLLPGAERDDVEERVRRALAGAPVAVDPAPGGLRWMSPSSIAPAHALVRAAARAWTKTLGEPPQLGCFPGGTDARLFCERGLPALSGVGPGALVRAHRADEWVGLDELDAAVDLYAAIIDCYLDDDEGTWT